MVEMFEFKKGLLNHGMTCIGAATRKKVLCIVVPNTGVYVIKREHFPVNNISAKYSLTIIM